MAAWHQSPAIFWLFFVNFLFGSYWSAEFSAYEHICMLTVLYSYLYEQVIDPLLNYLLHYDCY